MRTSAMRVNVVPQTFAEPRVQTGRLLPCRACRGWCEDGQAESPGSGLLTSKYAVLFALAATFLE